MTVTASAGSFGERAGELAAGWNRGSHAHFLALSHEEENGWRDFSPSDRSGIFSSSIWTRDRGSTDVRMNLARSHLTGNGAAPIQLLDLERRQVFTHPDLTRNRAASISSTSTLETRLGSVEGNVHWRRTRTIGANGDDTPYEPCDDDPTLLCLDGSGIVRDPAGAVIRRIDHPLDAVMNNNRTHQSAYGITTQLSRRVAARHRIIGGVSIETGDSRFRSWSEVANLTSARAVETIGVTTADSLVSVDSRVRTASLFGAAVFELTSALSATTSLRANRSSLVLEDQLGTALDGDHRFTSVNPSLGLTWGNRAGVVFGGFSQSTRTPTPVELTCADENDPCRLPNAFVSDPPLEQVVARTIETGFRTRAAGQSVALAMYRTEVHDDIIFVSSGRHTGEGHFENAGRTRREGVELIADGSLIRRLDWYATYSLTAATFRDTLRVASPHHPFGDGSVVVEPGARIPQIPRHTAKAGVTLRPGERTAFGAHLRSFSSAHYRGDEANLAAPVPGYTVVDLTSRLRIARGLSLDVSVRNVTNARYATFGAFGEADDILGDEYDDPRFLTPAAPRNVRLSLRWRR
jgi:iron complex outermembrane recepter protein